MTKDDLKKTSKYLSYILRHAPDSIGLTLDAQGWALVSDLISKAEPPLTQDLIKEVVRTNAKQRFSLNHDGSCIRANQGHSIQIDLGLAPQTPPNILFNGTAKTNLASIRQNGLLKGTRHHVHLSDNTETAKAVGGRHGSPIVLTIRSEDMVLNGHTFFQSANGVWLVEHVPPQFLE